MKGVYRDIFSSESIKKILEQQKMRLKLQVALFHRRTLNNTQCQPQQKELWVGEEQ
jgi:hypothetical protein